jgi:membrane glycosyltransferase
MPGKVGGTGLALFLSLTAFFSIAIIAAFVLSVDQWSTIAFVVSALIAVNALWISGGAATAVVGLIYPNRRQSMPSRKWKPSGRTAILVTLCGEDPYPLANYLKQFTRSLRTAKLHENAQVFVISDTSGGSQIANEMNAFDQLITQGLVEYRRRCENVKKKPGNIADWLQTHGANFDYMVVKDADSRMTQDSIRNLIWRLEQNPRTGLLQAAIALLPGRTRFGRYQRVSSRLLSQNFGHGFAVWSGKTGNYWGHNAIMRVEAFREAVYLPRLTGKAPFGGDLLSHDFVEAAWMRRAGWDIELAPDVRGSAEDAPQTLHEFFRRDRRWCQGNLQHIRLLSEPKLHALSRLHLITGVFSYLSAPIWLLMLLLLSFGLISISSISSLVLVVLVLLIPKGCALVDRFRIAKTVFRRRIILRSWFYEIAMSTLLGPLISLHNAKSVGAILLGRDCGWKSSSVSRWRLPEGWAQSGIGLSILLMTLAVGPIVGIWLAPIILPLIIAPLLIPFLNEVPA